MFYVDVIIIHAITWCWFTSLVNGPNDNIVGLGIVSPEIAQVIAKVVFT